MKRNKAVKQQPDKNTNNRNYIKLNTTLTGGWKA